MTDDPSSERLRELLPRCAHLRVNYMTEAVSDVTVRGRWECATCGRLFTPSPGALRAELAELAEWRDPDSARRKTLRREDAAYAGFQADEQVRALCEDARSLRAQLAEKDAVIEAMRMCMENIGECLARQNADDRLDETEGGG